MLIVENGEKSAFDKTLKLMKKNLNNLGWNIFRTNWKPNFLVIIQMILVTCQPYVTVYSVLANINDLNAVSLCCVIQGCLSHVMVKMYILLFHHKEVKKLYEEVNIQCNICIQNVDREKVHNQYNKIIFFLIKSTTYIYNIMATIIVILPIIFPSATYGRLPIPFQIPYVPWQVQPYSTINYIHTLSILYFGTLETSAIDFVIFYFILVGCFKMDALINMIKDLNVEIEAVSKEYGLENIDKIPENSRIKKKIQEIYVTHIETIANFKQFNKIFRISFFAIFLSEILTGCMLLSAVLSDPKNSAMYMFLLVVLVQVFIYTFFGTTLIIKSEEFYRALCTINYYHININEQKALLTIIRNANKPLSCSAIITTFNMESFVQILKTSYSFFAVIQSVRHE